MTIRYLEFDLAKYHKNFSQSLYNTVMNQPEDLVGARATIESRKLHNMHKQVGCEIHRMNSYTRLKTSKKGILYAKIDVEHNVEEFVARFFMDRFPMFVVVISSKRGCFIAKNCKITFSKNRLIEVLSELESSLQNNSLMDDINSIDEDEVWEIYYNSQFLKQRENKRYFLSSIPKKLLGCKSLMTEREAYSKTKKLKNFF